MSPLHSYSLLRSLFALFVLGLAVAAEAQDSYPNKPIRFIVPYAAGGATDILARDLGRKLTEAWGQPVIIDNRAGAGGMLGAEIAAKAPADGYTICMIITAHAINMSMTKDLRIDTAKDFAPIALYALSQNVLVVNPKVPANSVKELIALAKERQGKLNFSSSGNGTTPQLSGELFKMMAGVQMQHVPYKGAAPAMTDVIAGHIDMMFDAVTTALPHIQAGKVRPLGVTGSKRSPQLPDVPTIAEAALPGYEIWGWLGVVAPAGTPKEIVTKLNQEIDRILESKFMQERMASQSLQGVGGTPEYFGGFIKKEIAKWQKIVKDSGAQID